MPLGTLSTKLSTREELLKAANVAVNTAGMNAGGTAPAHTPEVAKQTCIDVVTGTIYEWWGGVWH